MPKPKPLADVLEATPRTPSDLMAAQIREYRKDRGWSQRDLCRIFADRFGVTINPATLARLEGGDRRITVDEAAMFAVALNVPLVMLFWPIDESEPVSVAPGVKAAPWEAIEWSVGNDQLPGVDVDKYVESQRELMALGQLITASLNASDIKHGHLASDYTQALRELALRLHGTAADYGVATAGIIPDDVQHDLDEAIERAPMRKERMTRGGDS